MLGLYDQKKKSAWVKVLPKCCLNACVTVKMSVHEFVLNFQNTKG